MKRRITQEGIIKLFFSISLLIYSILVAYMGKGTAFLAFLAMFLSTSGDIAIMISRKAIRINVNSKIAFDYGIIFFALAHVFYLLEMKTRVSMYFAIVAFVFAFVVILLSAHLSEKKKVIVFILYAVCLLLNAVNAWLFSPIAGIGGTLFVISDIILAKCEEKNPKWQLAIWGTYVPAQICLLTAILIK